MNRILLNDLFNDKSIKQHLVLSTSEGQYNVRAQIRSWDPIGDFFRNYMTTIVSPMRSTYQGKSYGSNARYIVEFRMKNGEKEVVPLYPRDYEIRKFKHFGLTKEALESKDALEEYLFSKAVEGTLSCVDLEVYELESWRKEVYEAQGKRVITAQKHGWFTYHVIGRVASSYENHRIKQSNKSLRRELR